jgi:hypothetical protein
MGLHSSRKMSMRAAPSATAQRGLTWGRYCRRRHRPELLLAEEMGHGAATRGNLQAVARGAG